MKSCLKVELLFNTRPDKFLTGVAYISKVRFEDGSVWKADINALIKELKKIEKDFDSVLLKGKDVLPPSK